MEILKQTTPLLLPCLLALALTDCGSKDDEARDNEKTCRTLLAQLGDTQDDEAVGNCVQAMEKSTGCRDATEELTDFLSRNPRDVEANTDDLFHDAESAPRAAKMVGACGPLMPSLRDI